MLDKSSLKFIAGFIGILILSFVVFAGSVYFKNQENAASIQIIED